MAYRFLELVNMVLDEIDEDQLTSSTFSTDTSSEVRRVKNYVNRIYMDILAEKADWPWARLKDTFSTVSGQSSYSVGVELDSLTDLQKLFYVKESTSGPMELLDYSEFKRKWGEWESTSSGTPYIAYVLDDKLYLYPTPSTSTLTIEYACGKLFTEMTAYTDTPLIPNEHRGVLIDGALYLAKQHEFEPDAELQYQVYQRSLQRLRNTANNNHKGYAIVPEEDTLNAEYDQVILLDIG